LFLHGFPQLKFGQNCRRALSRLHPKLPLNQKVLLYPGQRGFILEARGTLSTDASPVFSGHRRRIADIPRPQGGPAGCAGPNRREPATRTIGVGGRNA
ncbi:hypothetical protein, partial [Rhodopseudomonas sp. BAL398]|uniref:hypothetical protein n=1 Tax=Rhodopseudomonas sp. BAL398 TaxID=3034676 RepID=UPI0023E125DA